MLLIGGSQGFHHALVFWGGDVAFVFALFFWILSHVVGSHHLMGHNTVQGYLILVDNGQQIVDGALYLVISERFFHGVPLKLDADGEFIAALPAVEDGQTGMKGHHGGSTKDVAGAVGVDQSVGAHFVHGKGQHLQ